MTQTTVRKKSILTGVEYAKTLLHSLHKLQQYCGEPIAAIYADSLLRTMLSMEENLPFDPYTEIAIALHDALAFENRWIDYKSSQYGGVYDLLTGLIKKEELSQEDVEEAILALENLGFDTLPFGCKFDNNNDN